MTFSDLTIDLTGNGYTLDAIAAGLTGDDEQPVQHHAVNGSDDVRRAHPRPALPAMICPRCSVGEISEATQECLVCGFSRSGGVAVETSSEWNRVEDPLLPALERQFAVEGVLRRGSTSRIYLARDQVTGRLCSLKVLPLGEDVPEGLIERFRKDAQRAATLDHPHLVSLLSYGATDEAVWYAMEYVQGRSLGDLLRSADRMDLKTCLRLVEQIGSALEYGHRRGITHGNLKPANVLVDPEGWARVADLGVSAAFGALPRRAPEQSIEENYGHTAPEQFGPSGQLSPAADQYALAVLAFYCLARRPPIVGDTLEEITRHHREGPVPLIAESRPDLPAYVSSALARAMSRAPADRFPGVLDFVTAMAGVEVAQATEEKATEEKATVDEATASATVDTAAEAQPTLPEPAPAATAESTAVPATTAESNAAAESAAVESAAAEPASTSEPEAERKPEPEPELVAAMSETVAATSAATERGRRTGSTPPSRWPSRPARRCCWWSAPIPTTRKTTRTRTRTRTRSRRRRSRCCSGPTTATKEPSRRRRWRRQRLRRTLPRMRASTRCRKRGRSCRRSCARGCSSSRRSPGSWPPAGRPCRATSATAHRPASPCWRSPSCC